MRVVATIINRYYFLVFLLLWSSCSLMCMEQHLVHLKLDNVEKPYAIARWKVVQQSNMLCEEYGEQKQRDIITVPNITFEEIQLFDNALDTTITKKSEIKSFKEYFGGLSYEQQRMLTIVAGERSVDGKPKLNAKRLSLQLFDEWFSDPIIAKNNILLQSSLAEYRMVFDRFLISIIEDNIAHRRVVTEPFYSYESELEIAPLVKSLSGGKFKFMPKIDKLSTNTFNGEKDICCFEYENSDYILQAHIKTATNVVLALTSSKIQNDKILPNEVNVWSMNPNTFITKIEHPSKIDCAIFSPNGQWLATSSRERHGKLILTCLNPADEDYLCNFELVSEGNFTFGMCFNQASTLLVNGCREYIDLFDCKTKKSIYTYWLHNKYPLDVCFSKDDSRLICCLGHFGVYNHNQQVVMIWDTSNINFIKQLQDKAVYTEQSADATITFSDAHKDIVAVSTDAATFFFDIHSGDLVSQTVDNPIQYTNVATLFIPLSSLVCVAMKKADSGDSCIKIGMFSCEPLFIDGIGITNDLKFLITTFCGHVVEKMKLYSDEEYTAYKAITNKIKLVDLYLLLQIHRAKAQKKLARLHCSEYEYIRDCLAPDTKGKELVQKHFL